MREHLQAAARMTGVVPDELNTAPLPSGLDWLWQAFCELSEGRGNTGFGPAALTWRDLRDWSALMHVALTPWEAGVIRRLDREFLKTLGKNSHVDQGR